MAIEKVIIQNFKSSKIPLKLNLMKTSISWLVITNPENLLSLKPFMWL